MIKFFGAAILASCLTSLSVNDASAQYAPDRVGDADCYGETLEVKLGRTSSGDTSEMLLSIPLELMPSVTRQREYDPKTDPSQTCLPEPVFAISVSLSYSTKLALALSLPKRNIGPKSIRITLGNVERSRRDVTRHDLTRRIFKRTHERGQLFLLDEGFLKTLPADIPAGDYMPLYGMSEPLGSFLTVGCGRALNFGGWEFANCRVFYTLKNDIRIEYSFRYGNVATTVVPGSTPINLWREVDASIRKLVLALSQDGSK